MSLENDAQKWKTCAERINALDPSGKILAEANAFFTKIVEQVVGNEFNPEDVKRSLKILRGRAARLSGKEIGTELALFIRITEKYATKEKPLYDEFWAALTAEIVESDNEEVEVESETTRHSDSEKPSAKPEEPNPFDNATGGCCSSIFSIALIAAGYFLQSAEWTTIGYGLMIMGGLFLLGIMSHFSKKMDKTKAKKISTVLVFVGVAAVGVIRGVNSRNSADSEIPNTDVPKTEKLTAAQTIKQLKELYEKTDYDEPTIYSSSTEDAKEQVLEDSVVEQVLEDSVERLLDSANASENTADGTDEPSDNDEILVNAEKEMLDAVKKFDDGQNRIRSCTSVVDLNKESFENFQDRKVATFYIQCDLCSGDAKEKCPMDFKIDEDNRIYVSDEW